MEPVPLVGRNEVLVTDVLAEQWPEAAEWPTRSMPLTSGVTDLDRIRALQTGRATILTGHPGVGTSALAIGVALHVATHDQGSVVYVTDHLEGHEVKDRMLAQEGRLDLNPSPATAGSEDRDQRHWCANETLERLPIAIMANVDGVTPKRIADVARSLERIDKPPRLLVVDRVASLRPTQGGPQGASQLVSVLLDAIGHYRLATLLVEQPRRHICEVHQGPTVQPRVSVSTLFPDLAPRLQSLLWLHRPEIFDEDSPDKGIGEIHVPWQRHGARGVIRAAFLEHLSRWANLARSPRRR